MLYVSAFDTLENEGLDEVLKLLRREIIRHKATLLVLDGLMNVRSRSDTPLNTKKFVAELQVHASFAGCTTLLLTSAEIDHGSPELTMVDGVFSLRKNGSACAPIASSACTNTGARTMFPGSTSTRSLAMELPFILESKHC